MKSLFILTIFLVLTLNCFGQKADTVFIGKQNLEFKNLHTGNSTYIIFFKKAATSPAERLTLVKINVESTIVSGKKVYAITQQWDAADALVHTSYTLHDANDFSTLLHETWWKRLGYSAKFDFTTKQVDFKGALDDSAKFQIVKDFDQSFSSYNLCWHSDLTIFPLFPYQNGRTLIVNFYDPGFGKAEKASYKVTGSEFLVSSDGSKIDCWMMEHKSDIPSGGSATQRFWISKRTHEVLKEEDQLPSGYRYKMKIGIAGDWQPELAVNTVSAVTLATTAPEPPPEQSLSADLMKFFTGEWSGAGAFAGGKKIEADVAFTPDLDNRLLVYRHTDRAPNTFKALATWSFDRNSQKLLMTMNDNFGGARLFVSEGWQNGALVFTKSTPLTASPLHERFTYKGESATTFRMTYESSKDGKEWKMGDYLVFTKKAR